jgi:branched-chain amino acid transport system permease protein
MVLIMIWRPRGLVSTREPSLQLAQAKPVAAALVKQGQG